MITEEDEEPRVVDPDPDPAHVKEGQRPRRGMRQWYGCVRCRFGGSVGAELMDAATRPRPRTEQARLRTSSPSLARSSGPRASAGEREAAEWLVTRARRARGRGADRDRSPRTAPTGGRSGIAGGGRRAAAGSPRCAATGWRSRRTRGARPRRRSPTSSRPAGARLREPAAAALTPQRRRRARPGRRASGRSSWSPTTTPPTRASIFHPAIPDAIFRPRSGSRSSPTTPARR